MSTEWIILVQNQGESSLNASFFVDGSLKKLNILEQHNETVWFNIMLRIFWFKNLFDFLGNLMEKKIWNEV